MRPHFHSAEPRTASETGRWFVILLLLIVMVAGQLKWW